MEFQCCPIPELVERGGEPPADRRRGFESLSESARWSQSRSLDEIEVSASYPAQRALGGGFECESLRQAWPPAAGDQQVQ